MSLLREAGRRQLRPRNRLLGASSGERGRTESVGASPKEKEGKKGRGKRKEKRKKKKKGVRVKLWRTAFER